MLLKHPFFVLLVLACLVLIMPGCVSVTPVIPDGVAEDIWKTRSEKLYQQDYWTAHLAIVGKTTSQKFKTRAIWEQKGNNYTIKLLDFIGRTIAVIESTPHGVQAKTSKGQQYRSETAEQLIQQLFDIKIPVSGMRYWLLGIPKPDSDVSKLQLNQQGLADEVRQEGWLMSYSDYLNQQHFQMPGHILLGYEDVDLSVRTSQWSFASE